jgi:autotransporter-associated beta strand protein
MGRPKCLEDGMNVSFSWTGTGRFRAGLRAAVSACALAVCGTAGAQVSTNLWGPGGGGDWNTGSNWTNGVPPNGAGEYVQITGQTNLGGGFTANGTLTLNASSTVGYLIWGDRDRGSQVDIRSVPGTGTLVFDTGDAKMALLSHGSGDMNLDIGNGGDDTDVGIHVADSEGLYFDNWQTLYLYGGATNSRALDGGGNDIVKGEDGTLVIQRITTNVNNFVVRDGKVQWNLEGNAALMPQIANLVVGAAPGVVDSGAAHPLTNRVHAQEGTVNDRIQLPIAQLIGLNQTNYGSQAVQLTNTFNVTMNRGILQLYNRPSTNGAPAVLGGDITLNGDASESVIWSESQDLGALTSSVRQMVFSGTIGGTGGFTKMASGEMTLHGTNPFTGVLNINREFDRGRGMYGGVGLREGGAITALEGINLVRNGSLYLDNSVVNMGDRVNDAAWIVADGRSRIEILGNASAASSETLGAITNRLGRLAIELDAINASPQAQVLNLASLTRTPGGAIGFHASDTRQGVWATNAGPGYTVNLLDGGASLAQVGGGGAAGQVNRSLAIGVFGGDAGDLAGTDLVNISPNRVDEFMTVDAGRLRTLDPLTEMVNLGNRSSNALVITQASAPADANVNLDFQAMTVDLDGNLGAGVSPELITKRVTGNVTFNSIRLGIVSNAPGAAANDAGRSILLGDGTRLTSESGMLLVGRDTGSAAGDHSAGGNMFFYHGILDLDGAANNREAIVHNSGGHNLYVRSVIEAANGFTKSGENAIVLDAANRISGTVYVAQSTLYPRNSGALGVATQVVVSGDGLVTLQWGVNIAGVDLVATELPWGKQILQSDSSYNVWGGDILLRTYDPQGFYVHEPRIVAALNTALTLTGDIGIDQALPLADIAIMDPQRLSTSDSAGILNLYGTFGDRIVNGEAVPIDATVRGWTRVESGGFTSGRGSSENDVLRFRIDGPGLSSGGDELVVNIANPWRATGRIYAEQGTIRFLGDPAAGKGEFWDALALTNANFANGLSGFQLGGDGTDGGGSATFLLTKDGQVFNAERWTVAQNGGGGSYTNTALTMGLEHFGPTNATVQIGNSFNDGSVAGDDNRITFNRDFRVFAHNGWDSAAGTASVGRVNIVQTLRGDQNSVLTKVGNGVVALQGPDNVNYDESNDIRSFHLLGGELILDRSPGSSADLGLRRTRDAGAYLTLAGGDLTHLGSTSITTEMLTSNLVVRAGDSTIRSRTSGATGTNGLFIATAAGASVTRMQGGTVNFERDLAAGGNAGIHVGLAASTRLGSWAVYSSNGLAGASWAETDGGTNVNAYTAYAVGTYGAGLHSDVVVNPGFGGNAQTASLRFNDGAWMGLGGNQIDVTEGGILITPNASDGLGGMSSIDVGSLTSSGGELIVHNYNTAYGFGLYADIVGSVALTHSGPGRTMLAGNNTFDGIVYLNGGSLAIDHAARLGNATNSVELRGGALEIAGTTDLGNRKITLGGDGGIFRVAAGVTGTVAGLVSTENNILSAARLNNGHGDLIKEGPGVLVLGGANTLTNTYQGLTDIRAGTLLITRSNQFVLGSNKSFYDGTIVRSNATLQLLVAANNNSLDIREWLVLEHGATLRVTETNAAWMGWRWNGVVDFRGDAVVDVSADGFTLNNDAGYLMGPGRLIKAGNGELSLHEYSPEFTGGIEIQDGRINFTGISQFSLPNAGTVYLGMADTTDRGEVSFAIRSERDEMASVIHVPQSFVVRGNSSGTRIGFMRQNHNDVANFTGDIDLSGFDTGTSFRELQLYMNDEAVSQRKAADAAEVVEEAFLNFSGDISGGDRRIRTYLNVGGSPNTQDRGAQFTNEVDYRIFFTLSGTNTGWTGSLEVGNRTGTGASEQGPDFDKQHFLRFGNDDGLASLAISSGNVVVLRNNAHLQAYGSQVTIGTLISDGQTDNVTSDYYDNDVVADTWLENGGSMPGSFTINQHSNRLFQGIIRDGTVSNPGADDAPAAALSITKAGPATLTLDQVHTYSGTTRVMAGTLALTGSASIATSPTIQIDAGAEFDVTQRDGGSMTLASGQTLMGEGTFDGGLILASGATNAPGSSPGVLTATGDVEFQSGSVFSVELVGTLAGEADQLLMSGTEDTLTLGGATLQLITPNVLPVSASFIIIDGFSVLSGTFAGLPNSGDTVATANNTFEIYYNLGDITLTVVPEPGTLGFLGLAGLLGWLVRRRR